MPYTHEILRLAYENRLIAKYDFFGINRKLNLMM